MKTAVRIPGLLKGPTQTTEQSSEKARGSISRRIVLGLLRPMRRGRMVIEMPDGSAVQFGGADETSAARLPKSVAPEARIVVRDEKFFRRCVLSGDVGFGESYVAGEWDSPDVTAVVGWFLLNIDDAPTLSGATRRRVQSWIVNLMRFANRFGHALRRNTPATARRNIREHYDVSNSFFEKLLDPSMMYSGGIWESGDESLSAAQERKNDALCRLLQLKPTDRVLEVGTGWGGWSIHAATRYGCRVTTLTISEQQFILARDRVSSAGLQDRIDVQLVDFRQWNGTYDKIVSIEMMEALGHHYLPDFCRFLDRSLARDGLLALQFITCPDSRYESFRRGVDFIQKHVFPGSLLLSINRVNEQLTRAGGFVLNSLSDYGPDYARTLREWRRNLNGRRAEIEGLGFDDRFFRSWRYYLAYCEAAFAMQNISVVQTLHTRPNNHSLQPVAGHELDTEEGTGGW